MNNLLLIIGIIALSNGSISLGNGSLFDNKNKSRQVTNETSTDSSNRNKKVKTQKKSNNKKKKSKTENILGFNMEDINKGIKLMDLSEEDLERGMEIIARTKKYMSKEEKKLLIKVESLLDLVRGIKKLSSMDAMEEDESNFFRSMDEEDKKNMMIKEILEVFPEKRKDSIDKAIDMKKKIDLFAELFLPDDFGEGGFSLSSLVNINNLGSMNNLKLLGNLLRNDEDESENDGYEEYEEYEDDEKYDDDYDYEDDDYTE